MAEIFKLFPLCIYKSQLEDEESDLISNYADESISQYINSDINGDSQYQTNPDFNNFFKKIEFHLIEYCKTLGYDTSLFDFYIIRSWINNFNNNSNDTIHRHSHPFSDISICYYPTPSINPICFENTHKPNEIIPNSYLSNDIMAERNEFNFNYFQFEVNKNDLILFPSKTYHWVNRYLNEENRISFSADIILVLKENITPFEFNRNPINTWKKI